MTIYVTKYALSEGILEIGASTEALARDGYLYVGPANRNPTQVKQSDWFGTKEEAVLRAKSLRDKKVKSLRRQIARLLEMNFDVKPWVGR